jgi:telomerase reverse transcriptase
MPGGADKRDRPQLGKCLKRKIDCDSQMIGQSKRKKTIENAATTIEHRLLSRYYPRLQTLRQYFLSKLPSSSRIRRKKLSFIGLVTNTSGQTSEDIQSTLGRWLDSILVGTAEGVDTPQDQRWERWVSASQRGGDDSHLMLSGGAAGSKFIQAEVGKINDGQS